MLTATLPPALAEAVRRVGGVDAGSLSERYRSKERSGTVARSAEDVAAYAVTRLPATYAAVAVVLREAAARLPGFAPRTQLDLGAGLGAALWAARETWPSLERAVAVEAEPEMARLGRELAPFADWRAGRLPAVPDGPFDLVTVSYVLNELDEAARDETVDRAWAAAPAGCVVVVEPGTPDGYVRVLRARDRLLAAGALTVAPCPHDRPCPLEPPDWCHFAVRLPRSAAHRAAKGAVLGHEDEKFSYVAAARTTGPRALARVLRHPQIKPGHVRLQLCTPEGIADATVSKRHGELFKRARKISWGEDLGTTP